MADAEINSWSRDNRDLLVRLNTQVEVLTRDVREMRDNTSARLAIVEATKLDRTESTRIQHDAGEIAADMEKRLRFIERYMWLAIGGLVVIEFILNFVRPDFRIGVQ